MPVPARLAAAAAARRRGSTTDLDSEGRGDSEAIQRAGHNLQSYRDRGQSSLTSRPCRHVRVGRRRGCVSGSRERALASLAALVESGPGGLH